MNPYEFQSLGLIPTSLAQIPMPHLYYYRQNRIQDAIRKAENCVLHIHKMGSKIPCATQTAVHYVYAEWDPGSHVQHRQQCAMYPQNGVQDAICKAENCVLHMQKTGSRMPFTKHRTVCYVYTEWDPGCHSQSREECATYMQNGIQDAMCKAKQIE
jgi:hypothetical protein